MNRKTRSRSAKATVASAAALMLFAPAAMASGGVGSPDNPPPPKPPTVSGTKAKLLSNGKAIPPASAPRRIKRAIYAANRIRRKPYVYGGGHRSFNDRGYDCSGAVSYALHAAGLLRSPVPSGSLMKWGNRSGRGRWITVYANGGHTYAIIAGLRWDTSAVNEPANAGSGPRWRRSKRSPQGYAVRSFRGL